jgi:hypothetical protein
MARTKRPLREIETDSVTENRPSAPITEEEIAQRAYALYEKRGREDGQGTISTTGSKLNGNSSTSAVADRRKLSNQFSLGFSAWLDGADCHTCPGS